MTDIQLEVDVSFPNEVRASYTHPQTEEEVLITLTRVDNKGSFTGKIEPMGDSGVFSVDFAKALHTALGCYLSGGLVTCE
jgi:hypothetical protein